MEITIHADPMYQHLLLTAEKKFLALRPDQRRSPSVRDRAAAPRLETVKVVNISASNSWAEFAATYQRTRLAHQEHKEAKANLKKLLSEAAGQGLNAKRSKSGAISFDLVEAAAAPVQ